MKKWILVLSAFTLLVGCSSEPTNQPESTPFSTNVTQLEETEIPTKDVWKELSTNVKSKDNGERIILSVFDDEIIVSCPSALPTQLELEVVDLEEIILIRLMYYYDGTTTEGNFIEYEIITITNTAYEDEPLGVVDDWFIYHNLTSEGVAKLELNSDALEDYKVILQNNPNPLLKFID